MERLFRPESRKGLSTKLETGKGNAKGEREEMFLMIVAAIVVLIMVACVYLLYSDRKIDQEKQRKLEILLETELRTDIENFAQKANISYGDAKEWYRLAFRHPEEMGDFLQDLSIYNRVRNQKAKMKNAV